MNINKAWIGHDIATIKKLVDDGIVGVNEARTVNLVTPLMIAAHEFDLDSVKHFLAVGADVNTIDKNKNSVLSYLIMGIEFFVEYENCFLEILKELLANNLDLTIKNDRDMTGIDIIMVDNGITKALKKDIQTLIMHKYGF